MIQNINKYLNIQFLQNYLFIYLLIYLFIYLFIIKILIINNLIKISTSEVLLVEYEETYQLIEKMIRTITKPFRSKLIHIGMDEVLYNIYIYLFLFHFISFYFLNKIYFKRIDLLNILYI